MYYSNNSMCFSYATRSDRLCLEKEIHEVIFNSRSSRFIKACGSKALTLI
jgi:hypothetical protein